MMAMMILFGFNGDVLYDGFDGFAEDIMIMMIFTSFVDDDDDTLIRRSVPETAVPQGLE